MKKLATLLLSSFLVMSLQAQQTKTSASIISVMGEASMSMPADFALIRVSVQTEAADAASALKDVNSKMSKVIAYLKQQEAVKEVKTEFVNMHLRQNYQEKSSGFYATQQLSFKLTELGSYDRIIADLLDLGINGISGVEFHSSQEDKVREELLTRAVLAARKKAAILAAGLERSLGKAIYVSDHQEQGPGPQPMMMESKAAFSSSGPSVAPGELELSVAIQVRFTLN